MINKDDNLASFTVRLPKILLSSLKKEEKYRGLAANAMFISILWERYEEGINREKEQEEKSKNTNADK